MAPHAGGPVLMDGGEFRPWQRRFERAGARWSPRHSAMDAPRGHGSGAPAVFHVASRCGWDRQDL